MTEEKKKKDKQHKTKSKKRKVESSDEETSGNSAGSSSSDDGDSTSDDTDDDSSSDDGQVKGKKKLSRKEKAHLEQVELIWPRNQRPKRMKPEKIMLGMSISKIATLKDVLMKERIRQGLGEEIESDNKPVKKKFKAMKDDGCTRLHPARFLALPRAEPRDYWGQVPRGKDDIQRHLPLQFWGVEGIPEKTIVAMHNRQMELTLDMMVSSGGVRDLRQAQVAVQSFAMAQRFIHPVDLSGQTVQMVLTEAGWAEGFSGDAKQKVALIKRFFEVCSRENASRAARKREPMDYEQTKAKWMKCVTEQYPQLGVAMVSQQVAAMSGGQKKQHGGASGSGSVGGSASKPFDGSTPGGGSGGGNNKRPGFNKPARFQGLPVCYGYNSAAGCRRLPAGSTAPSCNDGKTHFAHRCNYYLVAKGDHCLADHPKMGNH